MSNEQLLQAISDMLDGLEQRLEEKLEQKLDEKLEEKLEQKLEEKLEQKLEEKLEQKLDQKLDEKLDQKFDEKLDQKFDEKLQPINNRLEKLESEVSALRAGQIETRKEIQEMSRKVSDTYQLALDAWGESF